MSRRTQCAQYSAIRGCIWFIFFIGLLSTAKGQTTFYHPNLVYTAEVAQLLIECKYY
jgi:hypothetical protein